MIASDGNVFRRLIFGLLIFKVGFSVAQSGQQVSPVRELNNDHFLVSFSPQGISSLSKTQDIHPTDYVREGKVFGEIILRFRDPDGNLDSLRIADSGFLTFADPAEKGEIAYTAQSKSKVLRLDQTYSLEDEGLVWELEVHNLSEKPVTIEDLAIPIHYNNQGGENPQEIFEQRVIKHHFISGDNSYLFWQRPTGLGPYLTMVPLEGTSLEYFSTSAPGTQRRTFQAFVHSAYTGKSETRGNWRQPHTSVTIGGGESRTYGFKFRWADDYQMFRDILVEEGLIDVQIMPGMTVPNDLEATIALRTRRDIQALKPEFPADTQIEYEGKGRTGAELYRIRFSRLGENKITIAYGEDLQTILEFFVTEPLETLYKKRAAFLVNTQQHRDSTKWYDGLFGMWDMKNQELRGPDDPDGFDKSRLIYVLASDDPILGKAPYVAAKNVFYPNQKEIEALDYHIENFVWGGLQRTDQETPYPYGVYGTPDWKVNRNQEKRSKNLEDPNRDKMHIWRSYDYPHVMMLYYHMYEIAKMYPEMTSYLDKEGYLERATETAKAYFKYPYEILPWYETYKWGCYNELLIVNIIEELEKTGQQEDADWLRAEWEKKVKYFLYDDPYPFRSEYAVDATAYESAHALAKYAVHNQMQPDENLWYDKNLDKWYSHPEIKPGDGADFMERQLQANIASRGWIEPAYYYLGSDFRGRSDSYTLSYMSQMGGWAILDYALHYSQEPADYIRLGFASYLSSFALINSGTPESNYGFWYPGKANDGATGWAFEPQKFATPWIGKPQGRGPWYYDGEIDLGFGGATRMAATVVTEDPIFGLVAYGGDLLHQDNQLQVVPKDGLRRRIYYRTEDAQIDLELHRDGFERGKYVSIDPGGAVISFSIENRTGDDHLTYLSVKGLEGVYEVHNDGSKVGEVDLDSESIGRIDLAVNGPGSTAVVLMRK